MNDTFIRWLITELDDRGWSQRELARRAGTSQTTVSQVVAGQRIPTPDFCLDIAQALKVPAELVLRLAGHLPAQPSRPISDIPRLQSLVERIACLPRESQDRIINGFLVLLEVDEIADHVETPDVSQPAEQSDNHDH